MEKQSTSPTGVTSKEMKFSDTISYLLEGKKIHRLGWKDKEEYGIIDNAILKIHKPDGKLYKWILNDGDLSGKDFIVL